MEMRLAQDSDADGIWSILEPVIRAGETYTLPRDLTRESALADGHEVWLAEDRSGILGTYYLRANQCGGGAHVANCGYMTRRGSEGRGVARTMCAHSLARARAQGYRAMQFNFVVCTNERAVRLWESFGFQTVGRLPGAFVHPDLGEVDALVMYLKLP